MFSSKRWEREQKKIRQEKERKIAKLEREEAKLEREERKLKAEDYILTISAEAYAKATGKELSDYTYKSIYVRNTYTPVDEEYSFSESALENMVEKGEELGAEIIVDVRLSPDRYTDYLLGTAMILKKK